MFSITVHNNTVLLNVVNVNTKFAYSVALKDKTTGTVLNAHHPTEGNE
jgi:hypothetical protein